MSLTSANTTPGWINIRSFWLERMPIHWSSQNFQIPLLFKSKGECKFCRFVWIELMLKVRLSKFSLQISTNFLFESKSNNIYLFLSLNAWHYIYFNHWKFNSQKILEQHYSISTNTINSAIVLKYWFQGKRISYQKFLSE